MKRTFSSPTLTMGAFERLYLDKDGKQDVYVDLQPETPQHQIDSIRFLYRQFKQEKPGVILNDPKGYGKRMQTFMFLKALRSILGKSILIICDSKYLEEWIELQSSLTDYFDDVAVKTNKPFAKKAVFINTVEDAAMFSRPNWSIVVMDVNQIEKTHKDLLKYNFKTNFKIWIAGGNMKKLGPGFKSVYNWIYPKENFDENEYLPRQGDLDSIAKAIRLDAFLEDFFVRRTGVFPDEVENKSEEDSIVKSPKKISRKNKDPTGTKVKRTKERETDKSPNVSIKNKDPTGTKVKRTRENRANDSSALNSVKNPEVTGTKTKRAKRMILLDDEDEEVTNVTETINTININNSESNFNFVTIGNNRQLKSTLATEYNNDKVGDSKVVESNNNNQGSENTISSKKLSENSMETRSNDFNIMNRANEIEMAETEPKDENATKLIYEEDSPSLIDINDGVEAQNTVESSAVDFKAAAADIISNENNVKAQIGSRTENETEENNTADYKNALDDIVRNENGVRTNDVEIEESIIKNELINIGVDRIKDEVCEAGPSDIKVEPDIPKVKGIDEKLKELEEYTLNKFKGSFLDRLF